MRVIVIGAGISGLACATRLAERGADVTVLESSDRVGGVIGSRSRQGFLFELGPQSFQFTPALAELARSAGCEGDVVSAPPRAPRFVLAGGRLRPVPMGPQILVSGSLLGFGTRMRLVRDLLGRSDPPAQEESLAEFVRRKFGQEMLDRLAGPFVSGIYAGDPERLGLRDTFPDLYRWEKKKGSVLRGAMSAIRSRRESGQARPTLSAMRGGNATLLEGLATKLGGRVRLNVSVTSVEANGLGAESAFTITLRERDQLMPLAADEVVISAPPEAAGSIVRGAAPGLAELLRRIEYAPVAVVCTGYRRDQVKYPLEGFGFLAARGEGLKLLGTVWMSSLFPGRAPEGCVNMTSFVGGATNPAITELSPDQIAEIVAKELAPILGISGSPVETMVSVHRRALPQYNLGHRRLVEEIRAQADRIPGIHLIGNYLEGLATGACVDLAFRTADRVLKA